MSESVLLREVPLKKSEKAQLLASQFRGRVFSIDTDNPLGLAAYQGWTGDVQLRFVMRDNEVLLLVREGSSS